MRATLTINLTKIAENWRRLDARSACETAAVMKADAYGLGLAEVAPKLLKTGAKTFFTAITEEAIQLRRILGPGPQIYVFSGPMPGDAPLLAEHNLIPCLNSSEQLKNTNENNPLAIQLDTGMNRLGFEPADIPALPTPPRLVMSHLFDADDPQSAYNPKQLSLFNDLTTRFSCPKSLSATAGIHLGPAYHHDLTRPGIGLYDNALTLTLPVIQTRDVAPGETVGYGAIWKAASPSTIATLSAGYADGLPRIMDGAKVYSDGHPCPIVGRISMDLITVDITALDHTPQSVEIVNEYQTQADLARMAQTIPYEILTSLGPRYERKYIA